MTERSWPQDPAERLVELVHDLRTPLTVVTGFADLLAERGDALPAEQRADFLARLRESAHELREILDSERADRRDADGRPA
ncbi:histidine kinase dimerization/phospho-acceptor domain-containing protein [Conexibacter sp. SYSU D00693]|uniref:histidine kinase dimerization/phospho-acceptor domain-containing protein n=1 Tax=Conexibacter sp. SYSU D00693 TaxID=2812560 RepID=UPI00196A4902|nr:histidine kinase dimerization/phospho-acceptor domain-containing protein [Conexibacter sp. SYSU D00693]